MNVVSNHRKPSSVPLLVDLDGSLIRTDTLYETAILFVKNYPFKAFLIFVWLAKGKHVLKRELYRKTKLNVNCLPYREEVLTYLEQQHASGRKIILFTGSWLDIAISITDKFTFIDDTVATNNERNLTGYRKAIYAKEAWGARGYDYLGNENKDLLVWEDARRSIVVGDEKLASEVDKTTKLEKHFPVERAGIKVWLRAARIHQWAKNALLFVPLMTAQKFMHVGSVTNILIAFFSFGCCASATYLVNDLLDLESDRGHTIKMHRPLAAGLLSIPQGVIFSVFLIISAALLALLFLNVYFMFALTFYLLLTILYSFKLKSLQTIDVIVLASLFTVRIIAGGAAIEVTLSFWLLCFSMFVFLSLAMVKRVSELISAEKNSQKTISKIKGRGYFTADIVILQSLGSASGFIAVLVFALYINSVEVTKFYNYPEILWFICPVLGYWIMRIWMLTARNEMNEDPISFAITDRNSWLAIILVFCAVITANML